VVRDLVFSLSSVGVPVLRVEERCASGTKSGAPVLRTAAIENGWFSQIRHVKVGKYRYAWPSPSTPGIWICR
jgi:hypothetical protein